MTQLAVLLFLSLCGVYSLTTSATPSLDAESAHFAAWHMVNEGTPWIEDSDFLQGHPLREVWVARNGDHEVISRAPGVVAASTPAYFLSGLTEFSNVPGGLTAAVLSAAAVALVFLSLRARIDGATALVVALAFGLGTPVWSVAADAVWPHTLTVLAIGGMAWSSATGRWWLVGLFGGVGLWGRSHLAIVVAVVGLAVGISRRRISLPLQVAVPALGMLALSVLWTRWLYGEWRLTGSYAFSSVSELSERYPNLLTNELGLFFSLERGVLIWTPVLLLLVPALVRGWSEIDDWAKALAIGGLIYTLAQGYAQVFHGGDSYWGYRLGLELVTCLVPALAQSFSRTGTVARLLVAPVCVFQVLAIGLGASAEALGASAEDAWTRNSLAASMAASPPFALFVLTTALIGGLVVRRAVVARRSSPGAPTPQEP